MELIELWNADEGKAYELFQSFPENDNGFENMAWGLDEAAFSAFVEKKRRNSLGEDLPAGFVPDTVYILEDDGKYVGIFNFRHFLNGFLKNGPGHIGYGIKASERGKGYATEGLKLLQQKVSKDLREDEFYLTCCIFNDASLSVMLKCGAYIHHYDEKQYFTRLAKLS